MAYCFAVVTNKTSQFNAAALSLRMLALLEKIPDRAGKDDVHQLRTTARRLEVQLGNCPGKVAKSLKSLRRKAGKVRDIDVHLGLLKAAPSAVAKVQCDARSWEKLREALRSKRSRHLGSLRDSVAEAAPLLEEKLPLLTRRAAAVRVTVAEAHRRTSQARESFLQWSQSVPVEPEPLHQLRIDTKKLRYSLEPLEAFEESIEVASRLKQVQDAIGSWHDWATLQQLAEKVLASPAEPVCVVLRTRTEREFRKAHRVVQNVRNWMIGRKPLASASGANTPQVLIHKAG